jgi:hypothetical protein
MPDWIVRASPVLPLASLLPLLFFQAILDARLAERSVCGWIAGIADPTALFHPPQEPAKEKDKEDDGDEQHQTCGHEISEAIERDIRRHRALLGNAIGIRQHHRDWATLYGNERRNWAEDPKPMEVRGRTCALERLSGAILDQAR